MLTANHTKEVTLMMTELCQSLRNWFDRDMPKWEGYFTIEDGELADFGDKLIPGQYYRVIGSVLNDGVYQYGASGLRDEVFTGHIWAMAVPPAVIALASDIEAWEAKYGGVEGVTMSPYASESYGGYSYTKTAGSAENGSGGLSWEGAFRNRLNKWRKI